MRPQFKALVIIVLITLTIALSGCEQFRFAATENQKLTAWETHQLAGRIESQGTQSGSETSQRLKKGTAAGLAYIGAPTKFDTDDIDSVMAQAAEDAARRPTSEQLWDTADGVISLGIAVAGLFGGAYGLKGVHYLSQARAKSQALRQIVKGNELFKNEIIKNLTGEVQQQVLDTFKIAQKQEQHGIKTKQIVTEIKS